MDAIPLLIPSMPSAGELLPFLQRIDAQRQYTNFGPLNAEFEAWLAVQTPTRASGWSVCTVANATLGLELALQGLGLARGSRVLLPAITFVASATAVLRAGLVPLIGEVDAHSWLLTPALAREAIARGAGFEAVMPVATFGAAQDAAAWDEFSIATGIPVVIDAAGAFGNQAPGESVDVVYSFHATKAFGAGEGGAVVSADPERVERIRRLSNFGIDVSAGLLRECGSNAKMSEYHCAVALATAANWPAIAARRRELHAACLERLRHDCPEVVLQRKDAGGVYPLLVVRLPGDCDAARIAARLAAEGIGTRRWYCPPLHRHPALASQPLAGPLPVADALGSSLLGLPFFAAITDAQVRIVTTRLATTIREERMRA